MSTVMMSGDSPGSQMLSARAAVTAVSARRRKSAARAPKGAAPGFRETRPFRAGRTGIPTTVWVISTPSCGRNGRAYPSWGDLGDARGPIPAAGRVYDAFLPLGRGIEPGHRPRVEI